MAKQGSDEQWNGKEKIGKAMAMYARRGFDKQRQSEASTRAAKALRGGASQRLRDAMSGIDKQRKCIAKRSEGIA